MVTCQICGKEFITIDHHTQVAHGIHINEYRKMYPGCDVSDKEFLEKRRAKVKESCSTEEFRSRMSEVARRFHNSEEGQEFREKASERMKAQNQDPEFRRAGQEALRKKYSDPEERRKFSEIVSKNTKLQWERDHDNLAKKVGPHLWVSSVTGDWYRSYAEMFLADQLVYCKIDFGYESRPFKYYCSSKGKIRKYYPDFFLNDLNLFIEVKFTEEDISPLVIEKLKAVKAKGCEIIVVYHDEITKSPSITTFILNKDLDFFLNRTENYLH